MGTTLLYITLTHHLLGLTPQSKIDTFLMVGYTRPCGVEPTIACDISPALFYLYRLISLFKLALNTTLLLWIYFNYAVKIRVFI